MGRSAAVVAALAAVVSIAGGAGIAGASPTWGSFNLSYGVNDNDNGNSVAMDAAGNVYYIDRYSHELMQYVPSTNTTNTINASDFYGYTGFTVDSSGNVYINIGSVVDRVDPMGNLSVVESSIPSPGVLATDANGNLFVADTGNPATLYKVVGGVGVPLGTVPVKVRSMAVGGDGAIYVSNYGSSVLKFAGGNVSPVGSGWYRAESVAVDGANNVYVADESSLGIQMVTPSGIQTNITPSGFDPFNADEVFVGGSTLYNFLSTGEGSEYNALYTLPVTPIVAGRLVGLSVTGSLYGSGNAPIQGVTASWLRVSGAMGYTCTLLYGFNAPTSFTVTTSTPSCYFAGLNPQSVFGVSVVANFIVGTSMPASAFEGRPTWPATTGKVKHSVLCQRGSTTLTKWVTNTNPRCPSGWHRTLLL